MDTKGLQKEFISWCKSKNKSPKSEDETKQLFVAFMKEKHPEEYKKAVENQQKQQQAQTQKALHGAKLNYFKSLKNQCAKDEEVIYYKKGGSVSCGCKKKEDGGPVKKDCGGSAISNFKAARKAKLGDTLARVADATGSQGGFKKAQQAKQKQEAENKKKELDARFKKRQIRVGKDIQKGANNVTKKEREDVTKDKCGSKIKKHQEGSVIAQFKKHRQGGSLNGIPFMQKGTNKKGLQWKTAYPPSYIENGQPKYIEKPNYVEDWRGDKKYLVNPYYGGLMTPSDDYLVRDIEEAIEEGKPMGGYDATYHLKDDYHHNDPNRIRVSGLVADLVENRGLGYIPGTEWDDMGRRLVYNWQKKKNIKPKFLYSR